MNNTMYHPQGERRVLMRLHIEEQNKFNETESIRYKNDGYRFLQPCTLKLKSLSQYVVRIEMI